MSKDLHGKHFDVRTIERYQKKGLVTKADIEAHLGDLPNDEDNFEVIMLDDDELEMADDHLTDEEIENMPAMTEDSIDNFDFMSSENSTEEKKEEAPISTPSTETPEGF